MSIQFDWRFDDEKDKGQEKEVTSIISFSWRASSSTRISQPRHRSRSTELAASPWFCPEAQPELVTRTFDRRKRAGNIICPTWIASLLARLYAFRSYRRHKMGLTASQGRVHAALARTRPWLCPDVRPDSVG